MKIKDVDWLVKNKTAIQKQIEPEYIDAFCTEWNDRQEMKKAFSKLFKIYDKNQE